MYRKTTPSIVFIPVQVVTSALTFGVVYCIKNLLKYLPIINNRERLELIQTLTEIYQEISMLPKSRQ